MVGYSKTNDHGYYGGIFWRQHTFLKAGDLHQGHKHVIDHATLVAKGSVKVEMNDKTYEVEAPAIIQIDKDVFHKFTALEDDTIYFCIFAANNIAQTMSSETNPNDLTDIDNLVRILCSDCTGCSNK